MGKLDGKEGDGLFSVFAGINVNSRMVNELDMQAHLQIDDPVEQLKVTITYHQNEGEYIESSKRLIEALEIAGAPQEVLNEVKQKIEGLQIGHDRLSFVIDRAKKAFHLD